MAHYANGAVKGFVSDFCRSFAVFYGLFAKLFGLLRITVGFLIFFVFFESRSQ
jgi:hypothetical protein